MKYVEASDARNMSGLRLALTTGVPGPWGESAKKMFEYKGIEYTPVAQYAGQPNEALVSWTGIRNAPVAVYNDEPPRSNFQDIVALAERLKPEPRLIPADVEERWMCLAISADICGEGGFGWMRRHVMGSRPRDAQRPAVAPKVRIDPQVMRRAYGGSESEHAQAAHFIAGLLDALARRLETQHAAGSNYFVGAAPTACDIHWACFSALLEPLPHEVNPMPEWLRQAYSYLGPVLETHKHPILLEHRNHMFERHLGLPLDF